uniref:Uncharacterized protein n=1 Tax=Leersia perrieri TaxID=77586 RepID=A0A0D9WKC8_9ORYZ
MAIAHVARGSSTHISLQPPAPLRSTRPHPAPSDPSRREILTVRSAGGKLVAAVAAFASAPYMARRRAERASFLLA